jgi:hypothetical protein
LLDTEKRSLALQITSSGVKSWILRYRLPTGERKRITLGAYPAMSLSKARDTVAVKLASVVEGKDPSPDKKSARAKADRQRLETLSVLAEKYFNATTKIIYRGGKIKFNSIRHLSG